MNAKFSGILLGLADNQNKLFLKFFSNKNKMEKPFNANTWMK